ncbi:MAG: tRNA-dihydrouridine synthase [Nitrospirae bacterium]|nr:MAG: tRNA-dihydrouridine synthase [Nitrospirota bacterium]
MTPVSFWHKIPQPIIGLSPMDGVTDPAFRYIVARYGKPDVQITEFVSVDEICHGGDAAWNQLQFAEIERPIVAQIYGADPDTFYQVAQVVCELGFDGVDINMGCPSKSVSARGCGAALIRNPPLAREIIRAVHGGVTDWAAGHRIESIGLRPKVVERVLALTSGRDGPRTRKPVPVSVKTRLGYDAVVIEDWVSVLLEERPDVISIHGRTLAQMYRGRADWGAIARAAKLIRETSTLALGNGDVESLHDLVTRVQETQVHGVLIGRGALGNPWLFRAKEWARAQALHHIPSPGLPVARGTSCSSIATGHQQRATGEGGGEGECLHEVPLPERFQVALEHARYFESLGGAPRFAAMRKHLGWYCKGFFKAAEVRSQLFRATSSQDVERILAAIG